ncbi:hypothetical protein [Solemya velum gill symbiont]|uniref:hypothetical protein n=1 Tax=Solemya velum gill symbiont TaxID=2340 RepID=UPI000996FCC4|nr:hypothetical protein [Solemya velum gill symbiont]OOZ43242.1 hypothetical protein BOW37_11910 [Solemya velum gill symbiont]OOZ45456.1 hypothetical protein BOW38_09760 [Solemya velum gill symbiont]OOZ48342.1 hypothetical protein BOW39_11340 [Solemya velum gill symbiont]OOZ50275.1 hypothetical protein BOW40_10590 [Solemya velum gill symbiont]OOZ53425.1 hypothetical protein BOW41_09905 [Solemya velum gill symbiont]
MTPRKIDPKPCACGCGQTTKTGTFLPGHDQKLRAAIEREVGGLESLKEIIEGIIGHEIESIPSGGKRRGLLVTPELSGSLQRSLNELGYQFEKKANYMHGSREHGDSVFIHHSGLRVRATKYSRAANLLRAYLGQPNGSASVHGGEEDRLDTWTSSDE